MSQMRTCLSRVLLVFVSLSAGPAQEAVSVADREVLELAQAIVDSVAEGDPSVLNGALDWDAIGQVVTKGIVASAGFQSGFMQGVQSTAALGTQICLSTTDGGSYTFLRKREQSGRPTLLFRMLTEGGVNYHEFQVARDASGRLRLPDVYIYLSGEMLTETLRSTYLLAAAESKQGLLDRLLGKDRDLIENVSTLKAMGQAASTGDSAEVVRLFATLPESLRRTKMWLIMKLQAEANLDDEAYAATIEEMEKLFPGDPALDLISIDGLYMKKQYDELDAVVDRLDRRLGGDAYLDLVRGGFDFEQGKFDLAKEHYRRAIEREPEMVDAWWSLVTISLEQKDWKETVRLLTRIEADFELELSDPEEVPDFAEFVKSGEYAQWKAARTPK